MENIVPIIMLTIIVTVVGLGLIGASALLRKLVGLKSHTSSVKGSSYECGVDVQETGHTRIPVKYYLTAILFILFDIEIIFMYPWAVAYGDFIEEGAGIYIFASMAVFMLVFIFGLFWEVKSKALEWE